ncbi:hypothetical protein [Salininema proteolyticum]|uniref:Uncharacterized protein n=1 Tax=Salininema proteolyticum TaxID=1607685 RepID=A0ABV8TTM6_9ACTN
MNNVEVLIAVVVVLGVVFGIVVPGSDAPDRHRSNEEEVDE